MSHKGPLLTLLVGVALAAVLLTLSTQAHTRATAVSAAPEPSVAATSSPSLAASPSPKATVSKPPPASGSTTYAGRASSGGATIGMTMKNGSVIAYVCDGVRTEAWLHGTATTGGRITGTGTSGSRLTGTFTATKAALTVTASGHTWQFYPSAVHKPSGLWRGAANVRGAKIVAGWVVLADGTQVGVTTVDGAPQPAPSLDTTTGTATINGGSVSVTPAEPTS